MNRDIAQGEWKQLSGKIKQKWGKLTDDDLTRAQGDRDYLVGKVHEQYGLARDKVQDELQTLGYREDEADADLRSSGRSHSDPAIGTGSPSNRGNPSQKAGSSRLNEPQGTVGDDMNDEQNPNFSVSGQQDRPGEKGAGHTLEAGSADKSGQRDQPGQSGSAKPGQGQGSSSPSRNPQSGADKDAQKRGPQGHGSSNR